MNSSNLIGLDEIADAFAPDHPEGGDFPTDFNEGVAARVRAREEAAGFEAGRGVETEETFFEAREQAVEAATPEAAHPGPAEALDRARNWAPRWLRRASAIAPTGAIKVATAKGAKGAGASLTAGPLVALAAVVVVGSWLLASALRLSDEQPEKAEAGKRSLWTSSLSPAVASTVLVLLLIVLSGSAGSHALLLAAAGSILLLGTLSILRVHFGTDATSADALATTLASFLGQVGFPLWIAGGHARVGLESLVGITVVLYGALWLGRHLTLEEAERLPVVRARRGLFLVSLIAGSGLLLFRYPFGRTDDSVVEWIASFDEPHDELLDWEDLQALAETLPADALQSLDRERLASLIQPGLGDLHPSVVEAASALELVPDERLKDDLELALDSLERSQRGSDLSRSNWTPAAVRLLVRRGDWTPADRAALETAMERDWPEVDRYGALREAEELLRLADVAGIAGFTARHAEDVARLLERRIVRCHPWLDPVSVAGFETEDQPGLAVPLWPVGRASLDSTVAGVRLMERLLSLAPERYAALDVDVAGIARYLDGEARGYVLMRDATYAPRAAGALRRLEAFDPEGARDRIARPLRLVFVLGAVLSVLLAVGAVARAGRRESVFSGPAV